MITRLFERLDDAAATIVPLAYLAGLLLGTMAYFAGLTLDVGVAVGVALAIAAELHSFLEQRRVRALWVQAGRAADVTTQLQIARQLRIHLAILCTLVAFSAVNATAFAAETWAPAPGFLPAWLQIGIRGGVVPLLFLATGALTPLHSDTSDTLMRASQAMQRKTVKATVKQWNARVERARRAGVDLAPVAVSLLIDGGDLEGARRVQLIADGLAAAESVESGQPRSNGAAAVRTAPAAPALPTSPTPGRPPTGPGTPGAAPVRTAARGVRTAPALELLPAPAPVSAPRKRTAANSRAKLNTASVEARVRRVWQPGMSTKSLARAARISASTASKWHALLTQEEGQAAR